MTATAAGPLETVGGPPIPLGRRIELPGRGTTFVREVTGPPGAPVLVLSHGWIASAGLNWYQVFDTLGDRFRVIAPDHRGHARGLRARRRFRLADCADDLAAILDEMDVHQPVIAVGYSMGGPISQLLWHRHRDRVAGLVLVATSDSFVSGARERYTFTTAMAAAAGTTRVGMSAASFASGPLLRFFPGAAGVVGARPGTMQRWAGAEMRRHDPRMLLEAGHAIGNYDATPWIADIDVPTAVVVTTLDKAIRPDDQRRLVTAIPGATEHEVADGHMLCAKASFAAPLLAACQDVADRV